MGLSEACLDDFSTRSATGKVAPTGLRAMAPMLGFVATLLRAHLNGSYRRNPFFNPDGTPAVQPRVLSLEERRKLA